MICSNVLEAMGNTPLIKLSRIVPETSADILVKFEALNVGGSIKTRSACNMITEAEKRGELNGNSVIVEVTSGNQGIGLALASAVKGYKCRIIMPDSVSEERRKLVTAYGAELVLIHDDGDIGKCMDICLKTAEDMASDKNVWMPRQFENPDNTAVHYNVTAKEILDAADCRIDGFCSGIGTGGTLSGIGNALKEKNPSMIIVAAEPENAAVLTGGKVGSHIQMGIGDGFIPDNLDKSVYDEIEIVSDDEAVETARLLMRKEGLMCGISSGTNVAAALRLAKRLGKGKTVVTILPDTAERYFSTELFD